VSVVEPRLAYVERLPAATAEKESAASAPLNSPSALSSPRCSVGSRDRASWRYVSQRRDQVRGEAIAGLVRAIANERMLKERKALRIRLALRLMVVGLVLIGGEAATLAANEML
jgi:hypothetical protein